MFKKLTSYFISLLGIKSTRTKKISKHVVLSLFYKGGSILANFLLVPITINYLNNENYGIWLTLSSFVAWFSFFDIGLGQGLRNKFTEAKANDNFELAKGYVSTAYYTIGAICFVFGILAVIISYFIDWTLVFNTSKELQRQLRFLVPVVFACFSLQLVAKLITTIYIANQRPSVQGLVNLVTSVSSLFIVWLLTFMDNGSLLLFGSIFSIIPVIILVSLNIYAFSKTYKIFKPEKDLWKRKHFDEIFGLGVSFFIIQLSMIILYATDNFIITQLFGPEEVVPYSIAYKYFNISLMVFIMVLTPFWSGVTEAYVKKEFEWIKKSMRNLIRMVVFGIFIILIMVLVSSFFYKLWVGDKVIVPFALTISMAIFFVFSITMAPFNFFINGIGKIRLHMYSFALAAIVNIPLSIMLVKYLDLGVEGIIIATVICIAPNLIIFPVQYNKLISGKAKGVWNK